MKEIKIYTRTVLERTGYRKYPYKESKQVTICYAGQTHSNHSQNVDNPKLKVPFAVVLDTRSSKELSAFLDSLGRSDADKWTRRTVTDIIG